MAYSPSRYEHTRCCRLGWAFERTGWLCMLAVTIAAAFGVFGNGWYSTSEVRTSAWTARYPRFARAHAPLELVLEWTPERSESELWIARDYLDLFEIEEVLPAPAATEVDSRRVYYTFRSRQPQARIAVHFRLKPEHAGRFDGEVGFTDGSEIAVRQIVFP
jgi:uncharacterized protein YhdP